MADETIVALMETMRKQGLESDVLREGVRLLAQALMEAEVTARVSAEHGERTVDRSGYRNGYRDRQWDTRVGTVDLRVPRVRDGGFIPSLLEPRRRTERALVAVVQEAYVHGVSTRRVDALVQSLGMQGISKSQVSRMCAELDEEVRAFRERRLDASYPYVWLDATFVKMRQNGRIVSQAVVVAIGVRMSGEREVLGYNVGQSEDGAFWEQFLRSLVGRGLGGVQLVISDAHAGLRAAIGRILTGVTWQRCRVHFLRNVLTHVPKSAQALVAATIRTVFAETDPARARRQWREIADKFRTMHPTLASWMDEAENDVLAYLDFPSDHWKQIWSTNPLERLNKEIKRRTDVVGIFPNRDALLRLVGAVLSEQHDEWQTTRRYLSETGLARLSMADGGMTLTLAV